MEKLQNMIKLLFLIPIRIKFLIFNLLAFCFLILSCETTPDEIIRNIPIPTSSKSSEPNLHKADDGTIYLTWIEVLTDQSSVLKFSTLEESNTWTEPITIAKGNNWFINWADFPSLTSFGKQDLAAHYLEKSANGTYTYDVKMTISNDNGSTWNSAFIPHTDGTNSEHGFVSKLALNDDRLLSIWLDGRQYAYAEENDSITKEMTLRSAIFNSKGETLQEFLIDERVCDCCQTDVAMTEDGPIVVYRNRTEDEVRDIYYSRLINNTWTEPKPIYDDRWIIAGCPVNGPAIASKDNWAAVVWYTLNNNTPEVKLSFSRNNGEFFEAPIVLSSGSALGRVDIEMLDDYSALVTWMNTDEGNTTIQMQKIDTNGAKSNILTLAQTTEDRSSGFPRMVVKNDIAYMAYTLSGKELSIKTLVINTKAFEFNK